MGSQSWTWLNDFHFQPSEHRFLFSVTLPTFYPSSFCLLPPFFLFLLPFSVLYSLCYQLAITYLPLMLKRRKKDIKKQNKINAKPIWRAWIFSCENIWSKNFQIIPESLSFWRLRKLLDQNFYRAKVNAHADYIFLNTFKKKKVLIFGCTVSLLLCGLFFSCRQPGATLCCSVRPSHCSGFFHCGAQV